MRKPAIEVSGVSKKYRVFYERNRSLKEAFVNRLKGRRSRYEDFWALQGISFQVRPGETLGIIGRNGSGKSTLLKLLGRILLPDRGEVTVRGRVSALLELGAGFSPELTGKKNIYLNSSILGFRRAEIDERLDEIVAFSGLEDFIDAPVKTYSTGMYVRLGFAVAIHLDPDVLLIDEILAVGDERFQQKCLDRMDRYKQSRKTIVFVSHDLAMVQSFCTRVLLVDSGSVVFDGSPTGAVDAYHELLRRQTVAEVEAEEPAAPTGTAAEDQFAVPEPAEGHDGEPSSPRRWGNLTVEIQSVRFVDAQGVETNQFTTGSRFCARMHYLAHQRVQRPVFGCAIHTDEGTHLCGPNAKLAGAVPEFLEGEGSVEFVIDHLPLMEGDYHFTAVVYNYACDQPYDHQDRMHPFRVLPGESADRLGLIQLPCHWRYSP